MPARLAKSSWCGIAPVLTLPELLTIRWKQPLLEQTSAQRLALTEGDVAEVCARGTGAQAFEAHQLPLINKRPLLHS